MARSRKVKFMIDGNGLRDSFSPAQRQLLEKLLECKSSARSTERIPRLPSGTQVPLSSVQSRIWFVNRMYPDSAEYNVLGPPLNLKTHASREHVEAALRTLMERHDSLRLRVMTFGENTWQEECTGLELPLVWHDLSAMSTSEARWRAFKLGNLAARTPFKLDQAPLFRVLSVRLP